MGLAGVARAACEALTEWGVRTRWLGSQLAYDSPRGRRVRVGVGSELEVGVLVVERNFAEFSSEIARDYFGKRHEPSLRLGGMVRRRWKDPVLSAVQTQEPKTKVSPRLKATVGLMKMEVVEFAI
jgi:hypothetical protein